MRVRYTPRARNDLIQILAYLIERSPGGAHNVRRAIDRTIELIGEHPTPAAWPVNKEYVFYLPVAIRT